MMDYELENMPTESWISLADLCAAIAERRVRHRQRDGYVEVSVLELRRLLRQSHSPRVWPLPLVGMGELDASHLA
jgi:hypothetical protein